MRLCLLLSAIILKCCIADAQITWEKTFGTSGWDESRDLALSNDGGYVLAGLGDYTGQICPHDYWIFKLDANGDSIWNKCYDLSLEGDVVALNTCFDGGYIITGTYDTVFSSGKHNVAILKIDSAGNEEWHNVFGGDSLDKAVDVVPTLDGGFIFIGTTWSYDGSIPNYHDQGDVWVIKIDSSGNLIWQKAYAGTGFDEGISIIEATPNKYLVVAHTKSQDGDVSNPIGYNDAWVLQLDSSGNITWEESYGDSLDAEFVHDAVLLNDGSIVLSGSVSWYNNNGGLNVSDLFLMRISAAGALMWTKFYGSDHDDYNGSLTLLSSGELVLTGWVQSAGNNGDVNCFHGTEYSDIWMVLLDTSGNMLDQRCLGGYQADYNDVLVEDASKNLVLAGTTLSNSGDVSYNHGLSDLWVVKMQPFAATGIYLPEDDEETVTIYPNPGNGNLLLNCADCIGRNVILTIADLNGSIIKQISMHPASGSLSVNCTDLQPGSYILTLTTDMFCTAKKLILQ